MERSKFYLDKTLREKKFLYLSMVIKTKLFVRYTLQNPKTALIIKNQLSPISSSDTHT